MNSKVLCVWIFWFQLSQGSTGWSIMDAHDTKKECEKATEILVALNARRMNEKHGIWEWQCLPQGIHPAK
jgi:hypothetical protein